jgi:hypothetical protein
VVSNQTIRHKLTITTKIPISRNKRRDWNGKWNATQWMMARPEGKLVKPHHTVIMPPHIAHFQTTYSLPTLLHLLPLYLSVLRTKLNK